MPIHGRNFEFVLSESPAKSTQVGLFDIFEQLDPHQTLIVLGQQFNCGQLWNKLLNHYTVIKVGMVGLYD